MQTVFPGEGRLKRRILRRIYKEMIINWVKKILGKKPDKNSGKEPSFDRWPNSCSYASPRCGLAMPAPFLNSGVPGQICVATPKKGVRVVRTP